MKSRWLSLFLVVAAGCAGNGLTDPVPDVGPPTFQREMRGMWIATVANIDWPWAALLSGTQGTNPGYDPLEFAIQEAHKRGLQLHAWINPFRAGNASDSTKFAATHVFRTRRDLVRIYGSQLWVDPGEPDAQDRTIQAVKDIVTRYDIDGIHADDFFYPYPVGSPTLAFPDDATYAKFGAGLARDDWRRANINRFVERMYAEAHAVKPTIQVGISPFGIWRPGNPAGVNGLDAYAAIFADSRKWLQEGWVDYLAPQLYWSIAAPQQSFPALLNWWGVQNTKGRQLWPGLAVYRVQDGTSSAFTIEEIPSQIALTRDRALPAGHFLYNTSWTLKRNNAAVATRLEKGVYQRPSLVPAYSWLDASAPPAPTLTFTSGSLLIVPGAGEAARWWTLRSRVGGVWTSRLLFGDVLGASVHNDTDWILVEAVDRAGNVSAVAEWKKP
jgi:uncharacterized lipoprotein YddW (UPF0748 family)